MAQGNPLSKFTEGVSMPPAGLLEIPCDVLIPAAIGGVITGV